MRTDDRTANGRRLVRRRRTRRVSRGQALVEFAMVVPLFLLMLFGFVEIALITASISAFNFAAKDAARLGALVGHTDATADPDMENLIYSRVSGVVVAKLVKVEIYKSDVSGGYLLAGNTLPPEDVYDANGGQIGTLTWPVGNRNDTLLDADYLGVRLTYNYTYLTSFLSGGASTLQLIANSVQRIEPQDFQSYHAPPVQLALVRAPGAGADGGWSKGSGGSGAASGPDTPVADVRRWKWGGAA